jgi:hypothetical protein
VTGEELDCCLAGEAVAVEDRLHVSLRQVPSFPKLAIPSAWLLPGSTYALY